MRWTKLRSHSKFRIGVVAAGICVLLVAGGTTWAVIDAKKVEVPELSGLSVIDAEQVAQHLDLFAKPNGSLPKTELQEFTAISSQEPRAGDRVFPGTVVTFEYELVRVEVPGIKGMTLDQARNALAARSLTVELSGATLVVHNPGLVVSFGVSSDADPAALAAVAETLGLKGDISAPGEVFDLTDEDGHYSWNVIGYGPTEGTQVVAGSAVEVMLALPITQVPEVIGRKASEASTLLRQAGLTPAQTSGPTFAGQIPPDFQFDLAYLKESYWGMLEAGELVTKIGTSESWPVISQSLTPGALVVADEMVDIAVEWPSAIVPDLSLMTSEDALQALKDAGFSSRDIASSSTGLVRSQTYPAGTALPVGARVDAEILNELTFSVSSSSGSGSVTWIGPRSFSTQQANGAPLPWSNTWNPSSLPSSYERGNLVAQMDSWDGWITCSITVNGQVVQTNTSTGAFAVVSCG